jgi:hypothetical protein
MILGAAGGLLAPELLPATAPAWLGAATGIAGAATGGGIAGGVEGAEEQGAIEAGGRLVAWPIKAFGRRLIGSRVGTFASEKLEGLLQSASDKWDAMKPTVSPQQAGRQLETVRMGTAKNSLDQIGQSVEDAAKTGPPVDWTPVKDSVSQMAEQMRPAASHDAAPPSGVGYLKNAATARVSRSGRSSEEEYNLLLKKLGVTTADQHPLPGVLGEIQSAPDQVSFEDAHKYKRMLDDAITWDKTAKTQLQGITKATRQDIRTSMSGHQPYDDATAAYRAAAPLFNKGIVAQAHKGALENPEAIVKLIKSSEPTKLQMLRDMLFEHGGESTGTAVPRGTPTPGMVDSAPAWDGIRSAWTYKNLIQGGVEKFPAKLAKADPEFVKIMYGDPAGQAVLSHLKSISGAYQEALTNQEKLGASSLVKGSSPQQTLTNLTHVAIAPHSPFTPARLADLALRGPKVNDLIQWGAYSPAGTKALVRAFTSPRAGTALADLYRGIFGADENESPPMAVSHGGPPTP